MTPAMAQPIPEVRQGWSWVVRMASFGAQAADVSPRQEEARLLLSLRVRTCQVRLVYQTRWHAGVQKKMKFRLLPVRKFMAQILRVGVGGRTY